MYANNVANKQVCLHKSKDAVVYSRGGVIKLVQVKYELLPAQKQFLELGVHNSDIDVSLYQ